MLHLVGCILGVLKRLDVSLLYIPLVFLTFLPTSFGLPHTPVSPLFPRFFSLTSCHLQYSSAGTTALFWATNWLHFNPLTGTLIQHLKMSTVKLLTNQPTTQPCSQATNSLLQQSPSRKVNSSSASQEIPCILRNVKVQQSIHMNCYLSLTWARKTQSMVPTQILQIHFNINLLLCLGLPCVLLPCSFPTKTLYAPFPYPCYTSCPSHSRFDRPKNGCFRNVVCVVSSINGLIDVTKYARLSYILRFNKSFWLCKP